MADMKKETYFCEACNKVFDKVDNEEWSDDHADKEFRGYFGRPKDETDCQVCDTCYNAIMKRADEEGWERE